jgi:hypothetical protein
MALRSALYSGRDLPPEMFPGTNFYQRLGKAQGHGAAGRMRLIEIFNNHIRNRTCDLPAYEEAPQPWYRVPCSVKIDTEELSGCMSGVPI